MSDLEFYITSYFNTGEELSARLSSLFEVETLGRNEFHTEAGNKFSRLSFVKSGHLRIFKQTEDKEVTQWISSPGEFTVDLNAIMFGQPARWNIQALTDCELYSISPEKYNSISQSIPEWPSVERLFLSKCFLTLEDRVFSFLSLSAEERYLMLFTHKKELFTAIPQQYLASMLGMTPETFSRIRRKVIS